ncbi:MAG: class I SAM-dependent methyltransferase [Nanoarchaeota archaeon]
MTPDPATFFGWFNYEPVYSEAVDRFKGGKGYYAEIGCFLGVSTAYLAQAIKSSSKDITLFAIDTWDGFGAGVDDFMKKHNKDILYLFWRNMRTLGLDKKIIPIRCDSTVAATKVHRSVMFDFIFIDGDHTQDKVYADLDAWWKRLKPNCIIAGHDYRRDVRWAIKKWSRDNNQPIIDKSLQGECWAFLKPK